MHYLQILEHFYMMILHYSFTWSFNKTLQWNETNYCWYDKNVSIQKRTPCHYLNFIKIVFLFTNVLNPECILHKAFLFVNLISWCTQFKGWTTFTNDLKLALLSSEQNIRGRVRAVFVLCLAHEMSTVAKNMVSGGIYPKDLKKIY